MVLDTLPGSGGLDNFAMGNLCEYIKNSAGGTTNEGGLCSDGDTLASISSYSNYLTLAQGLVGQAPTPLPSPSFSGGTAWDCTVPSGYTIKVVDLSSEANAAANSPSAPLPGTLIGDFNACSKLANTPAVTCMY